MKSAILDHGQVAKVLQRLIHKGKAKRNHQSILGSRRERFPCSSVWIGGAQPNTGFFQIQWRLLDVCVWLWSQDFRTKMLSVHSSLSVGVRQLEHRWIEICNKLTKGMCYHIVSLEEQSCLEFAEETCRLFAFILVEKQCLLVAKGRMFETRRDRRASRFRLHISHLVTNECPFAIVLLETAHIGLAIPLVFMSFRADLVHRRLSQIPS